MIVGEIRNKAQAIRVLLEILKVLTRTHRFYGLRLVYRSIVQQGQFFPDIFPQTPPKN